MSAADGGAARESWAEDDCAQQTSTAATAVATMVISVRRISREPIMGARPLSQRVGPKAIIRGTGEQGGGHCQAADSTHMSERDPRSFASDREKLPGA